MVAPSVPDSRYFGIDQSYTGTGLVCLDAGGNLISSGLIKTSAPSRPQDEIKRLLDIFNKVNSFITEHRNDKQPCIIMEDFAYGAAQQMAAIGGLGWFLRVMFSRTGFHFGVAPISSNKKSVTGKGNADKSAMILGCYKRWDFETNNDNIADARGLAHLCWCHYAKPIPDSKLVLSRDLDAISKIKTYH